MTQTLQTPDEIIAWLDNMEIYEYTLRIEVDAVTAQLIYVVDVKKYIIVASWVNNPTRINYVYEEMWIYMEI